MKNMRNKVVSVIGLGYVGLPLAIAFANSGVKVIGYDINASKIEKYRSGIDPTNEVGDNAVKQSSVEFTSDDCLLREANIIIIAVPTPINLDHTPNLEPVISASKIAGKHLQRNSIVVYESTVYPGVTEDVCIPILEEESGLKCRLDFKVGYSPERINPGDRDHNVKNIKKIVSGCDEEGLSTVKSVYDLIIDAGTYPVSSIRTAEAIKVIENSQRDINIAFMNEIAIVFDKMGIDTNEVIDGMNTKWNALGFRPGLVGGHCIGVDPYYFTYEAEKLGYHSQIILNGRIINDSMGKYVADATIKKMIEGNQTPKNSNVVILGLTFKENCPDIRNSKVVDIVNELNSYSIKPHIIDPWVDKAEAEREYGLHLEDIDEITDADCVIVAVAHNEFRDIGLEGITNLFQTNRTERKNVLIDVKGLFDVDKLNDTGTLWWRL